MEIWRIFNTLSIITSTLILNSALKRLNINLSLSYLILYTGTVAFMQATIIALSTGQTSIVMYLGVSLVVYAAIAGRKITLAIGFALILLKPQIGVPLMVAFLPFKKHHLSIFYASILTFLFALPGMLSIGPITTVTSFLNGLSHHSEFVTNIGSNSTGLRNFIYTFLDFDISSNVATFAAVAIAAGTGYYFSRQIKTTPKHLISKTQSLFFMSAIAGVCFFAPLHEYDLIILAPVLLLATTESLRFQYLIYFAFL